MRKSFMVHGVGDVFRDMLWMLFPTQYLSRWVDRRLRLGENFWLFVLGVNNSGTTALAKILESHPSVRTLPAEGHFLTRRYRGESNMALHALFRCVAMYSGGPRKAHPVLL